MQMHSALPLNFAGSAISTPGFPASVNELAGTISVRRYVHGLVKVSVYPDTYSRNARQARVALRRMMRQSDLDVKDAKLNRINRTYLNDMEKRQERDTQRLDSRRNLQRDGFEISGWGGLPGRKKFSANGALVINEVGQIGADRFGKSGVFLTGTVPGTGSHINEVVARYSSYLVNRVKQWFRRWFTQDYVLINVWEFQERGMLHIHLCVMSDEKTVLEKALREWKQRWNGLLLELGDKVGVDLFRKNDRKTWRNELHKTQHDAQWINFSVARYMAKYLSKAARDIATQSAAHPSQWWGADSRSKGLARAERISIKLPAVVLGYAKELVSMMFGAIGDECADIVMKELEKVPGVVFGGKFFDSADSKNITMDFFRFLTRFGGAHVEAIWGE